MNDDAMRRWRQAMDGYAQGQLHHSAAIEMLVEAIDDENAAAMLAHVPSNLRARIAKWAAAFPLSGPVQTVGGDGMTQAVTRALPLIRPWLARDQSV